MIRLNEISGRFHVMFVTLQSVSTHAPLLWVPRVEPAGEGERLVALFDEDDGRVRVTARRVGPQVFSRAVPRLLGLSFVGQVSDPQENLRWGQKRATIY